MAKINILGFDIANMIAAGEVVDRPASAVKELIENSLDAGATSITVEIRRGGIGLIRVSDNGCGMDAEDVPMAVLRHATSKISTVRDLEAIGTLGFRGEALAAISSVSHLKIMTKTADAELGTLLVCDGGEITDYSETGCAQGTTVVAEELFYNVPARRKFMKKDTTEAAAVTSVMEKMALSSPGASFKYICDGEVRFVTPGDGKLLGAAYVIFGRDAASRLIPIERTESGITVTGFTSEPDYVRSNHNMQFFFLNGRYIKSRTATAAVDNAYATRIPKERFPFCILNISIPHGLVDVNVHPSKLEVKFTNERVVYEAVYYAILAAITDEGTMPELNIPQRPAITSAPPPKKTSGLSSWVSAADGNELRSPFSSARSTQISIADTAPAPRRTVSFSDEDSAPPVANIPSKNTDSVPTPTKKSVPVSNIARAASDVTLPFDMPPPPTDEDAPPAYSMPAVPSVPEEERSVPIPDPAFMAAVLTRTEESVTIPITTNESAVTDESVNMPPVTTDSSEAVSETKEDPAEADVPPYVIIGEAYNCYVIVELEDRLIFIDKHAAHERIIFDELCRRLRENGAYGQKLMFPITEKITGAEVIALEEYRQSFERLGFAFSCNSAKGEVTITSIPDEIGRDSAPQMLISLAGDLAEGIGTIASAGIEFFEKKLFQASCKAAIKGGRVYRGGEVRYICDKLLCRPADSKDSAIKTCPHGRPVAFELRKNSIERQFSRLT